jgi:hypothetical protein
MNNDQQTNVTPPKPKEDTPKPIKPEDWFEREQRLAQGTKSHYIGGVSIVRT